jgi:hypothetical protein
MSQYFFKKMESIAPFSMFMVDCDTSEATKSGTWSCHSRGPLVFRPTAARVSATALFPLGT